MECWILWGTFHYFKGVDSMQKLPPQEVDMNPSVQLCRARQLRTVGCQIRILMMLQDTRNQQQCSHVCEYIYIYTPKPGRSPTRQYSVLSCFFPSSAASDFFWISRSIFFLWFKLIKCIRLKSSPLRSTLNTGYITGLDMCKVCTEAVNSVAL